MVNIENSDIVEQKLKQQKIDSSNESDEETMEKSDQHTPKRELRKSNVEDQKLKVKNDEITPKRVLSPNQLQKKLESEKKREQKLKEREERERKRQEEKEEKMKLKQKQMEEKQKQLEEKQKEKEMKEQQKRKEKEEREEQKRKEKEEREEQKRKEREEKELKRKEKEEREEQKRKEREMEKLKKQQEIEEKNKEKQKLEEQKQKAAAAFVNFFVSKKSDTPSIEEKKSQDHQFAFMPFEVKSDMKLPPQRRQPLNESEKQYLIDSIEKSDEKASYLNDLKNGKSIGKSLKTWPYVESSDDVEIVEEQNDLGETICEDTNKATKLRAKFLMFHENRRPPYYGTWSKKSEFVKARNPFGEDKKLFDYEVDSDDDWEEEEQGESLTGSDDEDKENDVENDDYEVDNEFFVPHGHLSDDEVDDEENAKLSPESLKQKLKLLKDEFDLDMQSKTQKLKPRSIGCIWYNKLGNNVDKAIDRYLQPLAVIANGQIIIRKREVIEKKTKSKKKSVKVEN